MPKKMIVNFHGIGTPARDLEPGEGKYWISEGQYDAFLGLIAGSGAEVGITFDDGNLSDYALGAPGLARHGLTAVFFPLAGRLDTPGSLSSGQVRELLSVGHRIGTHGYSHRSWIGMAPSVLEEELVLARRQLSDTIDQPVDEAAIPFGRYDRATLAALKRLGYRRVYSSDGGAFAGDPHPVPRWSVQSGTTEADLEAFLNDDEGLYPRLRRIASRAKKTWL